MRPWHRGLCELMPWFTREKRAVITRATFKVWNTRVFWPTLWLVREKNWCKVFGSHQPHLRFFESIMYVIGRWVKPQWMGNSFIGVINDVPNRRSPGPTGLCDFARTSHTIHGVKWSWKKLVKFRLLFNIIVHYRQLYCLSWVCVKNNSLILDHGMLGVKYFSGGIWQHFVAWRTLVRKKG